MALRVVGALLVLITLAVLVVVDDLGTTLRAVAQRRVGGAPNHLFFDMAAGPVELIKRAHFEGYSRPL